MRKIILFFTILSFVFLPVGDISVSAKTDSTTGFLSGDIWYSKAKLIEGDDVKIYTAFWNGENTPVNIKVSFFDKDTLLGEREVSIPALTLKDISISWKVTAGDHQIKASILKATSNQSGSSQEVSLSNNEVKTESIFIPKRIDSALPAEKLEQLGEKVVDILPKSVAEPVSASVSDIDLFRQKTSKDIENSVKETQEKIKQIENPDTKATDNIKTESTKNTQDKNNTQKDSDEKKVVKKDSLSGTEKPIAYLKFYLLGVALFIFKNSWLFYGIILFLIFMILRFIYRKIRGN